LGFFLNGVDRGQKQDFASAVSAFDKVLALEPDHFSARLCQAACLLHLKRPTEAKIALTACIGQRPNFVWNYLFRGQAYMQLSEHALAAQDFQRALEIGPQGPARKYLDESLQALGKAVAWLPDAGRAAFWNENIRTEAGIKRLGDIHDFQELAQNKDK
jgi:tetratricopeptide (TPR) repeat protein